MNLFRCWCRQGFTGSLCEYSEELRECEQDYCLHKGVGKLVNTTDGGARCECQCEEHHTGERVPQHSLSLSLPSPYSPRWNASPRGFSLYRSAFISFVGNSRESQLIAVRNRFTVQGLHLFQRWYLCE